MHFASKRQGREATRASDAMASTWATATLRSVVLFTPVVLAVEDMLVSVEVVKGDSMSPEVQHGDVVLVDKLSPRLSLFPRGAVAALWCVCLCVCAPAC